MKKLILAGALAVAPFVANAQYNWDFGGGIGAANVLGDMGGNELSRRDFVADMKLTQTRQAANAFARYKINQYFSVKGSINYVTLRGADSLSSNRGRYYRNLSFRNYVWEAAAEAQFFFYEINDLGRTYRYTNSFRAYVGLGVSGLYHNPKANYKGEWIALRPLETENYRYSKVVLAIPATAGFYFTFKKQFRVGWNLSWRTTFTDYLDDVSTIYVDKPSGSMAAILANRTNIAAAEAEEPGLSNNWVPGSKRGDPSHNDSFLTTNIEFSYVYRGKSSLYKSKYGNIFKGQKVKRRKVRAKF
jgi:hypothetical protein